MGRFSKIVEKAKAKQSNIPVVGPDEPYTTNEQMVTRMFKIRYADLEPLRGVLQQLVSQNGDTIPFQPDTLIINDIGSNMHRLERIIEQLDSRSSSDEMRVIQVRYASAPELATTIQKLFDAKANRPGSAARTHRDARSRSRPRGPSPAGSAGSSPEHRAGRRRSPRSSPTSGPTSWWWWPPRRPTSASTPCSAEIDVPISGEGRINVYPLQNANAEDIAATLQSLAQGTANRPRAGGGARLPTSPARRRRLRRPTGPAGVTAAELFAGEVKISADKATNSLVVVASQGDFRNLVRVIEKLDLTRRQVFIEAVIMEVDLDRNSNFGISLHQGFTVNTSQGTAVGLAGTKYVTTGVPPSFSLANLASYGGFLAGLQGPNIPAFDKLGLSIPSFGIVLHALAEQRGRQRAQHAAPPHQRQRGGGDHRGPERALPGGLRARSCPPPPAAAVSGTSVAQAGSLLGRHRRLLRADQPPERRAQAEHQAADQRQRLRPDGDQRETEEIASQDPMLGPTTAKRTAKTTVVAKDQETVVIGGIMQERAIELGRQGAGLRRHPAARLPLP